jgi:hypothetical protein
VSPEGSCHHQRSRQSTNRNANQDEFVRGVLVLEWRRRPTHAEQRRYRGSEYVQANGQVQEQRGLRSVAQPNRLSPGDFARQGESRTSTSN